MGGSGISVIFIHSAAIIYSLIKENCLAHLPAIEKKNPSLLYTKIRFRQKNNNIQQNLGLVGNKTYCEKMAV